MASRQREGERDRERERAYVVAATWGEQLERAIAELNIQRR